MLTHLDVRTPTLVIQEIHAKLIDVNEALRLVVMAEGLSDGLSRPWGRTFET